jgi:SAM-dependent methyltransferase
MTAVAKVVRSFNEGGLSATSTLVKKNLALASWRYLNRRFDRRYNVDTGGSIQQNELDIDSGNREFGIRYEPTAVKTFRSLMKNLPSDLANFTFVDYGSGKGRVLLLASHYNFKRIVGVEYAKDLHRIARFNIVAYRHPKQLCARIEATLGDAAELPIPDGPCVFYFFQPLTHDVMLAVLDRIRGAHAADPREMYILFLHPHAFATQALERLGFARKLQSLPLPRDFEWLYPREIDVYHACGFHVPKMATVRAEEAVAA